MWTESHGNLARHPKTLRLMRRLGWSLPSTIGNLHLLWWWALEFAPTGDLTCFEPEELTHDLDLGDATPAEFLDAMIYAGFIDKEENGTLRIHDWPDYTTKSLRPLRARSSRSADSSRNASCNTGEKAMVGAASTILQDDCAVRPMPQTEPDVAPASAPTETNTSHVSCSDPTTAEIPEALAACPDFIDVWWPKYLEMHETEGLPLASHKQAEVLKCLAKDPRSAVYNFNLAIQNFQPNSSALVEETRLDNST